MAGYIGSKSSVTLVDGYTEAEADAEFVNKTGDTMSGNLDVTGTVTADGLTVDGNASIAANLPTFTITGQSRANGFEIAGTASNTTLTEKSNNGLTFGTNNTERMRITSSGNLILNSDTAGGTSSGGKFYATPSEGMYVASSNDPAGYFNRNSSDGTVVEIRKNNSAVGTISVHGDSIVVGRGDTALAFNNSLDAIYPINTNGGPRDNAIDLGRSNVRFDDIYATNGTIQTSDFNEKQDIASLTATEMLVGKRISALFKTFRWKDSVAEKGDNARTHTGVIAQDVQAAFTAEGLDAGDYALFISNTWWETQTEVPAVEAVEAVEEVVDEDGNVTTEAVEAVEAKDAYTRTDTYDTEDEAPESATSKTRLGIRYPELLSFVAAYNEQRFASIEARLTALEA
jgi:hypothetical protein